MYKEPRFAAKGGGRQEESSINGTHSLECSGWLGRPRVKGGEVRGHD